VHGPIGCASYTWDIKRQLYLRTDALQMSFSTDMKETGCVFGGEKKLAAAIRELAHKYRPPAIFVYSTCIVAIIGDDIRASVARRQQSSNTCNFLLSPRASKETKTKATRPPANASSS